MRIGLPGLLLLSGVAAFAADDLAPDEIIRRFAAKEADFAKARANYTYRQSVKIQELTPGGGVTGQHEMVSDIVFSPEGKRTERVVRAPVSTTWAARKSTRFPAISFR
jgi:hypothetical protein